MICQLLYFFPVCSTGLIAHCVALQTNYRETEHTTPFIYYMCTRTHIHYTVYRYTHCNRPILLFHHANFPRKRVGKTTITTIRRLAKWIIQGSQYQNFLETRFFRWKNEKSYVGAPAAARYSPLQTTGRPAVRPAVRPTAAPFVDSLGPLISREVAQRYLSVY